jgi:hypothetical protein
VVVNNLDFDKLEPAWSFVFEAIALAVENNFRTQLFLLIPIFIPVAFC